MFLRSKDKCYKNQRKKCVFLLLRKYIAQKLLLLSCTSRYIVYSFLHYAMPNEHTIPHKAKKLNIMPANKNALIRYKTIDNCLRNRYRRWTIDDLVDACSDALYDCEGITKGVSLRTVQNDIQMMRSDKLGYNAPIEVYDHKFYRYAMPTILSPTCPFRQPTTR